MPPAGIQQAPWSATPIRTAYNGLRRLGSGTPATGPLELQLRVRRFAQPRGSWRNIRSERLAASPAFRSGSHRKCGLEHHRREEGRHYGAPGKCRSRRSRDCSDFFLPAFGLVALLGHQGRTFQCEANGSYWVTVDEVRLAGSRDGGRPAKVSNTHILGPDRHHASTGLAMLRRVGVLAGSSCILASLLYTLPSSAASDAYTLSEYPAGVGATAGTGALPQEVTVGPDGNLWYTDEVSGVFKFSPQTLEALACSASSPAVGCEVSANAVAPTDIVAGADGALWFTQSAGGNPGDGRTYFQASIGRITTTGSYTSYPVPASASSVPGLDAITLGPNGNLWFTETAVDRIGEITSKAADPTIHEFALPVDDRLAAGVGSSITSADTIAAGPGNDIWFTEQGSNAIGVMSTSGALLSKFTVPNSNLNPTPQGITEGPDDTMWFTENAANQVASITAQGKITVYALPGAASGPASIVYGPDGNLWFTDNTGVGSIDPSTGKVTLYRAHTASSGPVGITVGPDCTSIWFTESSADRLGRVAPVPNTTGCKPGAPIAVPEAPLSFSPAPLALGDVVVGSSGGVTKTLTVTNLTSQNITLGGLGLDTKVAASGKWKLVVHPVIQQSGQPKNTSDCSAGLALAAARAAFTS